MNKSFTFHNFFLIKLLLVIITISSLYSCKTKKTIIASPKVEAVVDTLSQKVTENNFQFEWLSGKMNVDYLKENSTQSFQINFRLRKDSLLWMSISPALGIEAVRILITSDSIKYVDKINKQYYKGDLGFLSLLLKTNITFNMLQALILGNEYWIEEKDDTPYSIDVENNEYIVKTIKKRKLKRKDNIEKEGVERVQSTWLHPKTFKISTVIISDLDSKKNIKINYFDFKDVAGQQLASKINAELETPEGNYFLIVNYNKLKIDKVNNIAFKIPDNYVLLR